MNEIALIADIEGYAAIFNQRDLNGDIIAPGAFRHSLSARTAPVRLLYQHASETPIGRWTSFTEDARGLFATGELILSSPRAHEIHALLLGGALDGLSIGYQTVKAKKTDGAARRIVEADLWEVSIVTFPMAPAARLTHVGVPRSSELIKDPRRALPLSMPGSLSRHERVQAEGPHLRPGGRASVSPPADVRHFADALRSAASIVSV